jgi:hypothetical protein
MQSIIDMTGGYFTILVLALGVFSLASWIAFQIECLILAVKYRECEVKAGRTTSILSAFGRIKAAYKGMPRVVTFKFEKAEDK